MMLRYRIQIHVLGSAYGMQVHTTAVVPRIGNCRLHASVWDGLRGRKARVGVVSDAFQVVKATVLETGGITKSFRVSDIPPTACQRPNASGA